LAGAVLLFLGPMESQRRSRLTDAERALWASYAGRIRRLPGRPPLAPAPAPEPRNATQPLPRPPATPRSFPVVTLAPLAVGTQPGGVDTASWQRLRTGKLQTVRTLDLHGYTAQRAFHALASFLRTAHAEGLRCVEVVTGQGGVLRRELPLWLNQAEFRALILAAVHPHAANPGSVRLLLRRRR
jgi:DNA-nicking Smr family endonuclease